MLNPTQKDIQELQKEFEDDARERAKEIALSEKLDNELLKKREAGEIGVSHGTDNYVSFLMIGLALFVSLILLLTTFGTPHIGSNRLNRIERLGRQTLLVSLIVLLLSSCHSGRFYDWCVKRDFPRVCEKYF